MSTNYVTIYQNQRWGVVTWGSPTMMERAEFSDRNGRVEYPGGLDTVALSNSNLRWLGDWQPEAW